MKPERQILSNFIKLGMHTMPTNKTIVILIIILILHIVLGCEKKGTDPDNGTDEITLDGRGGGVIAFSITPPNGNNEIFIMNADGSNQIQLTDNNVWDSGPSWSADGNRIGIQK